MMEVESYRPSERAALSSISRTPTRPRAPPPPCIAAPGTSLPPCPIARTLKRADLGDERAHVPNREPVPEAVSPHERVLVDHARHPGLAQGG